MLRRVRVAALLLAVLLTAVLPAAAAGAEGDVVAVRLQPLLEGNGTIAGIELASSAMLAEVYRQRGYRLAWDQDRLADFLRGLADAHRDGFYPRDFHARTIKARLAGRGLDGLPAAERVELDLLLSDALLRYIHHQRFGKVDPGALDTQRARGEAPAFAALRRDLEAALEARSLAAFLGQLTERPGFYRDLRQGLVRYRDIAGAGGWPPVPEGRNVESGMQDAQVPAIRARLAVTDGALAAADPADADRFDEALKAAVERFQARHGLKVDGVVGPRTRAAMNVSVQQRIDQIRVNLERMRWHAGAWHDDLLLVDIPGFRVDLYRGGRIVWSTRAIVGRPERGTPLFRDELAYLEFNPSWTVPPTILAEDILPKMRRDASYLQTRGLRVIDRNGRGVSPEAVDWDRPAATFPYLLRQPPSADNALGRVKFMFPNRYSVYLHDTPERGLFSWTRRALSSGCVRVEDPLRLAELVLDAPQRWNQASMQALLDSGQTRVVHLDRPLPVVFSYWTAVADNQGIVHFRPDIYDRDQVLLRALDAGRARPRIGPPPTAPTQTVDAARPRLEQVAEPTG